MTLKTVRVPASMEAPFIDAERHVSRYFRDRKDDPEHGTIEIFGERYILVRAASLSVDFYGLVERIYGDARRAEADEFAQSILFDLAHAIGKSDARDFHAKMGLSDPIAKLSAGPIHFAHAGWAFVDIFPESRPSPDESFCMVYDHPYSFEADAWVRAGKTRAKPACTMNAGYSSGWCEESFGIALVATEILCRAKGDAVCRFLMAPPERMASVVERYLADGSASPRRPTTYSIPDFFSRKRMEEELRRAQSELELRVEERTRELVRSNDLLTHEIDQRKKAEQQLLQTQKLEAIGRLAGGIAHDFNNLMAVVLGSGGLLARRLPEGDPLHPLVDSILEAGERAAKLTQQLLAFGRAQPLSTENIGVNDAVGGLARIIGRVLGDGIALDLRLAPAAGAVRADRGQFEQIIMNLVVNARDAIVSRPASARVGMVTIATGREEISDARSLELGGVKPGDYLRLDVSDTGVGMDEATLAQVFEPFFTTKEAGKGTGLGLATVYGIVKQLGGGITVASRPGEGSRFTIHLPRFDLASKVADGTPPSNPRAARGETVLLIEDQGALRRVVRELLEEYGYAVIDAGDPGAAMRAAASHPGRIDLLLTDVLLPNGSGPELAERFASVHPEARVLFMSGYADDALLQRARGASAGDGASFLAKPFTPDALAKKVREVLDGKRGGSG
jgi:signal transduction histidine kinase/CheY-like chemotaxis protein/predicted hydrocarbon binding protein